MNVALACSCGGYVGGIEGTTLRCSRCSAVYFVSASLLNGVTGELVPVSTDGSVAVRTPLEPATTPFRVAVRLRPPGALPSAA